MYKMTKKGFTIVEVLVAISILSIGIFAVISMLTTSLRSGSKGRAMTAANQVVQQQLEQVKVMTFDTMANNMCGYVLPQTPGFIPTEPCIKVTTVVFTNRTAVDYTAKYNVPASLGDLSSITYDVTMQNVKNYPVTDVDMVAAKAKWSDVNGEHNTTAMTFIER